MSEQKINDMEKDLHHLKTTVPPLMEEMKLSTRALISLTGEIKNLVEVTRKVEAITEQHDKRIDHLEKVDYARQSKEDANKWLYQAIGGAIVTVIVGAIASLIFIVKT